MIDITRERLITLKEAGRILACSASFVRKLGSHGLELAYVGCLPRTSRQALHRFVNSGRSSNSNSRNIAMELLRSRHFPKRDRSTRCRIPASACVDLRGRLGRAIDLVVEDLIPISEAARLLECSVKTATNLEAFGLDVVRIGSRLRTSREAVERYKECIKPTEPSPPKPNPDNLNAPILTVPSKAMQAYWDRRDGFRRARAAMRKRAVIDRSAKTAP